MITVLGTRNPVRRTVARSASQYSRGHQLALFVLPTNPLPHLSLLPSPLLARRAAARLDALKAHRSRQAAERLAADRWEDHDLIFPAGVGAPMEPRSLNRLWASLRVQAGMEDVKLHDLRHTMVTLLLDLGTPPHIVQAIARHADLDVTMKIYAHASLEEMRKAMDKLGDQLG